jgi:hypothetical protein
LIQIKVFSLLVKHNTYVAAELESAARTMNRMDLNDP